MAKATRPFKPARPASWLIKATQTIVRAELSFNNRVFLQEEDLEILRKLPKGAGVVLTSNHADEMDPRVVIELSRRSGRQFISMCNREAFDELFGLAGWTLQRLGHFSVERGAHDNNAKVFAIDVVREGRDILVIFPEGEIFYLNEQVQPFHSGAIDIAMQAIAEMRKTDPDWTALIVPMAIKYHHTKPIDTILAQRIAKMEEHLSLKTTDGPMYEKLKAIQKTLLEREQVIHNIPLESSSSQELGQEIVRTRREILAQVENNHTDINLAKRRTIDESWQLGAELREQLESSDQERKPQLAADIKTLEEVAQLASWSPNYYDGTSSTDRLAEVVLKLERELYRVKRPKQLAERDVYLKLATPVDLGHHYSEYVKDAHAVRHNLTQRLQDNIQRLIDGLIVKAGSRNT